MLQSNRINHVLSAKHWLKDGWRTYKKAPITWIFMILFFSIAYIIVANIGFPGKAIAALLAPVFLGGLYVAAFKADNGEPIAMENLFSMFKDSQRLKQLLTIGGVGVAVVGLTYLFENTAGSDYAMATGEPNSIGYRETTLGATLSTLLFWAWSFATIFSIPLVAITNQDAIESLKNSIRSALFNLIPLFIFFVCAVLLTILGAIPFGLGLFVVLPTLFCATYFVFKTVYLEGNNHIPAMAAAAPDSVLDSSQGLVHKSPRSVTERLMEQMEEDHGEYGPRDKKDVTLPKGFSVNYFDDYMQITRKWVGKSTVGLVIGAVIFNFGWVAGGFLEVIANESDWPVKISGLVFIVAGVVLIYLATASLLNKTEVYANKNAIAIQHHPIPWRGNKTLDAKNIRQIYVETIVTYKGETTYRKHHVNALTADDQKIRLISGLVKVQHANFVERKIEDYLGIEDKEVAEER